MIIQCMYIVIWLLHLWWIDCLIIHHLECIFISVSVPQKNWYLCTGPYIGPGPKLTKPKIGPNLIRSISLVDQGCGFSPPSGKICTVYVTENYGFSHWFSITGHGGPLSVWLTDQCEPGEKFAENLLLYSHKLKSPIFA